MKKPTANEIRLLALIAYQHGEISIGRCAELAGCKRDEVQAEMHKRCGRFSPYDEACREIEELKRQLHGVMQIGVRVKEPKP